MNNVINVMKLSINKSRSTLFENSLALFAIIYVFFIARISKLTMVLFKYI